MTQVARNILSTRSRRGVATAGGWVGLGVAAGFVLALAMLGFLTGGAHENAIILLVISCSTLLAGAGSGLIFSEAALRALGGLAWAGVVSGVAFSATLIGAALLGVAFGIGDALSNHISAGLALPYVLGVSLAYTAAGMLLVGPFVAPITVAGALIWGFLMVRIARRMTTSERRG